MRLLLINSNPAVSRLINLSAKKYGYEIEEFQEDDFDLSENFDVTIADDEAVSDNSMLLLRDSGNLGEIICIGQKGLPKPIYANYFLQKPFLPTDFVDMIKKIEKTKNKKSKKEIEKDEDVSFVDDEKQDEQDFKMEGLDLETLDTLDLQMPDDDMFDYDTEKENDVATSTDKDIDKIKNKDDGKEESEIQAEVLETKHDEDAQEEQDVVEEEKDIDKSEELVPADEIIDENKTPQELKLDEDKDEDEDESKHTSSILDSEDIDEVKLLLDENEQMKETPNEQIEEIEDKTDDTKDEDKVLDETNIEGAMDDISDPKDVLEDMISQNDDLQKPQDILEEIQNIDDEKENEESTPSEKKKDTLEDLEEDDFANFFDDEPSEIQTEKEVSISGLQEELQTKITNDVKKILDKDEIKEALKALKVNISISFDEK